jgi:hypothetical protein
MGETIQSKCEVAKLVKHFYIKKIRKEGLTGIRAVDQRWTSGCHRRRRSFRKRFWRASSSESPGVELR